MPFQARLLLSFHFNYINDGEASALGRDYSQIESMELCLDICGDRSQVVNEHRKEVCSVPTDNLAWLA
jgi:hypothetical protein